MSYPVRLLSLWLLTACFFIGKHQTLANQTQNQPRYGEFDFPRTASTKIQSKCFVIGRNPSDPHNLNLWNSRAFCEIGPVCYNMNSPKLWKVLDEDDTSSSNSCSFFHCSTGGSVDNEYGGQGCVRVTTENGYAPFITSTRGDDDNEDDRSARSTALCRNLRAHLVFDSYKNVSMVNSAWFVQNVQHIRWETKKEIRHIVMPRYHYMFNLYHAARPFMFYLHVFYGKMRYGVGSQKLWKILTLNPHAKHYKWLMSFRKWMRKSKVPFDVEYLQPILRDSDDRNAFKNNNQEFIGDKFKCFDKVIMLGTEGSLDSLLYVNDSDLVASEKWLKNEHISNVQPSVLHESLILKETMRITLSAEPILRSGNLLSRDPTYEISPPSLNFAFVDRLGVRSIVNVEKLHSLIQNLCQEYGFQYRRIIFQGEDGTVVSFLDQVKLMLDIGAITGVHGANLVNAIFMKPFGFVLEILPYRYIYRFYIGGSNSGLFYHFHMSSLPMGRKLYSKTCQWTDPQCQIYLRSVPIGLSAQDYVQVENKLRNGMQYVKNINNKTFSRKYNASWSVTWKTSLL